MAFHLHHLHTKLSFVSHPLESKPYYITPLFSLFSSLTEASVTSLSTQKVATFCHIFQACSIQRALNPGKQAHARMITSGFSPTIFVTNCLIQMYIKCLSLDYAHKVFDKMPNRDTISWNSMLSGYAGQGNMAAARSLFDSMPEKDVVSWNSLISGFVQNCDYRECILVFVEMRESGVSLDHTSFATLLKVCSALEDVDMGIQIHGLAIKTGLNDNVVTASALVDMYAKCKNLDMSIQVFQQMPEKNWVTWSAAIAGCVQNDCLVRGLEMFQEMQRAGYGVSQSTYASVFRSCAGLSALETGMQLHGHALKNNFGTDVVVATATLDMYAKCNCLNDAQKLFQRMPNRSLQSFNAIIVGYVRNDDGSNALHSFVLSLRMGLGFDAITLSGALSACAGIGGLLEGLQLHALAIKSLLDFEVCVSNALLDMYGKCGSLKEACHVFDGMKIRDAVSWNALIAAHEQNEDEDQTLMLFVSMLQSRMEPDEYTFGSVLKACAGRQALNYGIEIHNRAIKSGMGLNWSVGSALVDMYCKCGHIEEAEKIHNRTNELSMISWNAITYGFVMQKQSEDAQRYFSWMLESGVQPDNFTYATILDTCANLATLGLGKQIHAQILKLQLQRDVYICSTLVDMYSKCGELKDSKLMFDKAPQKDFVTWNAMICGYANHGLGKEALKVFEEMQQNNVAPNHATFVSVLRACAHIGLVEEGWQYFNSMKSKYNLDPQLEHYSCMVDILGRCDQINKAMELINEMPFEADAVLWRTLLSACHIHGNVEIAEKAVNSILQMEPDDSSSYILLSNIYANAGMWKKVSEMRREMKYNRLKKEPGCSWIEVKDEVHMFLIGDNAHPRCEEIYDKLDLLICEMKGSGYVPGAGFLVDEEEEGTAICA